MTKPAMRLVFVHPSDEMYGADRMLLEMIDAVPDDVAVQVWLPDDLAHPPDGMALCQTLEARGVDVQHVSLPILRRAYRSPRGLLFLLRRALRLRRTLRADRPDIVYCTTSAAFFAAPLARLAGVPRVLGHLQEIWSRSDRYALSPLAWSCHERLAISEAVVAALPGPLRRGTVIVPNGTPEPAHRSSLDGRSGRLSFLVASRWNGWKGHRTLLRAWDEAGSPGQLVVLGGPPLSGESVDVPGLVSDLASPGSVTVAGEVADLSAWYDRADVVVVPSDQAEPFGLVAIEAFAHGRPVIGSAAGGLAGIVTSGADGWLFPPRDVAALARVLSTVTRESVTAAGARARATFEHRFTSAEFTRTWRRVVFGGAAAPADPSSVHGDPAAAER